MGQVVLVKQDAFGDIGMEEKKEFTPRTVPYFINMQIPIAIILNIVVIMRH